MARTKGSKNRIAASTDFDAQIAKIAERQGDARRRFFQDCRPH